MAKIGFFSDVHGNLEALKAIMMRLQRENCDMLICLGDIVGYGANPSECVHVLRELNINCVLGNHDSYAFTPMDEIPELALLRPAVRQSIEWTASQLSAEDKLWLSQLPDCLKCRDFSAVHSSFADGIWPYCFNHESMARNFALQDTAVAFCGHSHAPLIGMQSEKGIVAVDTIHSQELACLSAKKVMVNVGSVGQPRDMDCRAAACIYDLEKKCLTLVREPYNIASARKKIIAAGLPTDFANRLSVGR